MGYRDEGEAALHRVASLEQQVVDEREQVTSLQQSLELANAEIVRLKGNPIQVAESKTGPVPAANRKLLTGLGILSVVALAALAGASYGSERDGMAVAHFTAPICGATLAAWLRRRQPMKRVLLATFAWGFVCLVCLLLFFATIWGSL